MESHKIFSVKIVEGSVLNPIWKSPMQIITTDKGEFIDNMPGKQFGFFESAAPGFDWQSKIGHIVDGIEIFYHANQVWINKNK